MSASGTVLVVGSGGREHALAWKLAQNSSVVVAPGGALWPEAWERWDADLSGRDGFRALAGRARGAGVRLAVIGPDNPLAAGIVDVFTEAGVPAFGPSAAAAQIEASKAFAKDVMKAAGVPTAKYFKADTAEEARKILRSVPWSTGWVIKADGLAFGKGVRVCAKLEEALAAAEELIRVSGSLVIEERLSGEEISWLALCDGEHCALLEPARDYKRLRDGDEGPNTGGMGAFSPVPGIPASFEERVKREVFEPTLAEMKRRGAPFRGVLYAGLMVDSARERFWVLEFNARFGDPETQVLLPRIEGDLLPWLEACASGRLAAMAGKVPFSREAAVVVVGAARGYPDSPEKGQAIAGPLHEESYFIAGAILQQGKPVTSGGRVFGSWAKAASLPIARERAYAALSKVSFEGMQWRRDIAGGANG